MLATNAGLLTPILGDPSPWNPERLYINGEAGAWYDPGDLTAEKVAWRRNLLTWSEDFTNAAWTKSGVTASADRITANAATGAAYVERAVTSQPAGVAMLLFVVVKPTPGRHRYIWLGDRGETPIASATFDLNTASVVGQAANVVASAVVLSDGSVQCVVQYTRAAIGSAGVNVALAGSSYTADRPSQTWAGTEFVDLAASFGLASSGSAYQRITDFTSDFLAAFPTHALYQDAAGTTPVTALGQPVGLALDKSRGALANVGADIVVNGDFTSSTGWLTPGNWTISGGAANANGVGYIYRTLSALAGYRLFRVEYDVLSYTSGTVQAYMHNGTSAVFGAAIGRTGRIVQLIAHTGANELGFLANSFVGSVDNLSIREVPGVHAIQPTSASRPALDARVNLLTYSEQFDNAVWTKRGACTVTANAIAAPDGTMTADLIAGVGAGGVDDLFGGAVNAVSGASLIPFVYIQRVSTSGTLRISNPASSGNGVWLVNLATLGSGWQAITAAHPAVTVSTPFTGTGAANSGLQFVATAGGPLSFYAWGADLRLATDAAYPYQRVVTATDYADVGVPRSFLHDGFDDGSYTASSLDLSGTDKVTVWAGVYKNSDAASGVVLEHSTGVPNNRFALRAPQTAAANYGYTSGGTAVVTATTSNVYAAPNSSVLSGVSSIADDICILRLNGAQVATDATDQGTGNYGNNVLFIGRRNNASLPFNGKVYCIIIRGAQTDAATLALTERYVGSRMGIVL